MQTIYDVGMHNGDDTEYYLKKGFNVVAIEADPELCADARKRFAGVPTQRLAIVNIGIADKSGELDFFVNPKNTVVNTFYPTLSTERNAQWKSIRVLTERLSTIIEQYDEPFFIKIDIENSDISALTDLISTTIRPPFISVEAHSFDVFVKLIQFGYSKFKIVNCAHIASTFATREIVHRDGTRALYSFPHHSSGPFGDDLPEPWLSAEQLACLFMARESLLGKGWYDIHAKL